MSITRRQLLKAAALAPLAGCAVSQSAVSPDITLQLDWRFNAQFAGPLLADHRGYFANRGLKVNIKPWSSGLLVTDEVVADPMTIGCAEQNLVLAAQAKGAPIKAIATMFQASPLALMTLPDSNINALADLTGKPVGVHIDGLEVMRLVQGVSGFEAGTINVSQIPYENKFDRLISGEMTAIQCYAVDEPINFTASTGIEPRLLPLSDYGYEAYAQVIFAHEDFLKGYPAATRDLLSAMFRGWQEAMADVPGTAEVIVSQYAAAGSKYQDLPYQTESLEAVSQFVIQGLEPAAIGTIDPARWQTMVDRFVSYNIIEDSPALGTSFAAEFWPVS